MKKHFDIYNFLFIIKKSKGFKIKMFDYLLIFIIL